MTMQEIVKVNMWFKVGRPWRFPGFCFETIDGGRHYVSESPTFFVGELSYGSFPTTTEDPNLYYEVWKTPTANLYWEHVKDLNISLKNDYSRWALTVRKAAEYVIGHKDGEKNILVIKGEEELRRRIHDMHKKDSDKLTQPWRETTMNHKPVSETTATEGLSDGKVEEQPTSYEKLPKEAQKTVDDILVGGWKRMEPEVTEKLKKDVLASMSARLKGEIESEVKIKWAETEAKLFQNLKQTAEKRKDEIPEQVKQASATFQKDLETRLSSKADEAHKQIKTEVSQEVSQMVRDEVARAVAGLSVEQSEPHLKFKSQPEAEKKKPEASSADDESKKASSSQDKKPGVLETVFGWGSRQEGEKEPPVEGQDETKTEEQTSSSEKGHDDPDKAKSEVNAPVPEPVSQEESKPQFNQID